MRIGLGPLRLSPKEFWSATPRELAAAWEGLAGRAPDALTRADLDALMRGFPDRPH